MKSLLLLALGTVLVTNASYIQKQWGGNQLALKDQIQEQQIRTTTAGMSMTLTQKFFDSMRNQVGDYLKDSLNGMELQDSAPEFNLGTLMPKVIIEVKRQKVVQFEIKEASNIMLQDGKQHIVFQLNGIDLEFHFRFNMFSKPDWFKDNGSGKISIQGLNISMLMHPYEHDGKLQVNFTQDPQTQIEMKNYELELAGTTDFSKSFNYLLTSFKDFFKNEISYLMSNGVSKAFNEVFNELLYHEEGPPIYPVYGTNDTIYFNYSMIRNGPIFRKEGVTIPFDGTFLIDPKPVSELDYNLQELPLILEGGKALQFFISEHTLSSAALAFHKNGFIKVEQNDFSSDMINLVFDNFNNVFGANRKVTVVLTSEDPAPTVQITDEFVKVVFSTMIRVKNPFNPNFDAILITAKVSMDIKPTISEHGLILRGDLQNLGLKVDSVRTLYRQENAKTPGEVEAGLTLFMDALKKIINENYLNKGMKLPMPSTIISVEAFSEGCKISSKNGYLVIEADTKEKQHKKEDDDDKDLKTVLQ